MANGTTLQQLKKEADHLVDVTGKLVDRLKAAEAVPDALKEQALSALLGEAEENRTTLVAASRRARIEELTKEIDDAEAVLQEPGLDQGTRGTVKGERDANVAERAQLNAEAASDFAGVLTATEVQELSGLLAAARNEVAQKKQAAAAIAFAMKLADIALSVAAKVAAL